MHGEYDMQTNVRIFDIIQTIIIPKDDNAIYMSHIYAKGASEDSHNRYVDSNQFNKDRIEKQHYDGILGEYATYLSYKKHGQWLINKTGHVGPDYTIYHNFENSWDPDFYYYGTGIGVKTQSVSDAEKSGFYGWVFQHILDGRKDPTITNQDAWTIFVTLDDTKDDYVTTIYPAYQTKELTFTDHTLYDCLKGKKLVQLKEDLPYYKEKALSKITKITNTIEDLWS